MHDIATSFINLDAITIAYLFGVGFVGGLVSGFIGSGGAFVLTPGMMSLGVPGLMAVASNMVSQVPQGPRGAMKRFKYGQVDVKLGIVLGVSAEAGRTVRRGHPGKDQGGLRRRRVQPLCERGLCRDPGDGRRLRPL